MPIQKKTLPASKTFKKSDAQQALEENAEIQARQVELEAAMEKGLIKKYAELLFEHIGLVKPSKIIGIPIREEFKLSVKESKAAIAKVIKALDAGIK